MRGQLSNINSKTLIAMHPSFSYSGTAKPHNSISATRGPSCWQSGACHAHLLSRDHNVLNDLIDDGDITPAQSENAASFMRGITSQFMADPECDEFKVNLVTHTWQAGERLLLCSDGLNEVLSDAEIAALLAGNSEADLLNACKASRRAGGGDDFSVIVLTLQ